MFNKNKIALSVAVGVIGAAGIMTSAQAVHVNPDGTGQVLLFPYYNAKEDYVTNINLVNSTDQTKAVRIHFRESKTSKELFDFNIYMSPNDVWTGTLRQSAEKDNLGNYVASLRTTDRTCTLPVKMAATCADGMCETTQNFHGYQYYRDENDKPLLDASDTQEGYIEVVEMGVVTDPGVQADVLHDETGEPANCKALEKKYWASNGIFTKAPYRARSEAGITAPTGGLFGQTAILNLKTGTAFAVDPVAIDNYTTDIAAEVSPGFMRYMQKTRPGLQYVPQHTRPDDTELFEIPTLASGNVTTSNIMTTDTSGVTQMVVTNWKKFAYDPNAEEDIDANGNSTTFAGDGDELTPVTGVNPYPIAHILSSPAVMNEYFLDPSNDYDGHTDWVVTFPMKKYGVAWRSKLSNDVTQTESLDTIMTNKDEKWEPLTEDVREMSVRDRTAVYAKIDGLFDREEGNGGDTFQFSPPMPCEAVSASWRCSPGWTELEREVNVINFRSKDPSYDSSYSVLSGDGQIENATPPRRVLDVSEFVSGWARLTFPGYGLSDFYDSAVAYGPNNPAAPSANSAIYQGIPTVGAAFISGKVVNNNAAHFGNAIPHKFQRD